MGDVYDTAEYGKLSAVPDDELMLQLGEAVGGTDLDAGRPTRGELIRRAEQWMLTERAAFAQRICGDPRIADFRSGKKSDKFELFLVICDCLTGLHGGVPVATVAVLLLRLGINTLCGAAPE